MTDVCLLMLAHKNGFWQERSDVGDEKFVKGSRILQVWQQWTRQVRWLYRCQVSWGTSSSASNKTNMNSRKLLLCVSTSTRQLVKINPSLGKYFKGLHVFLRKKSPKVLIWDRMVWLFQNKSINMVHPHWKHLRSRRSKHTKRLMFAKSSSSSCVCQIELAPAVNEQHQQGINRNQSFDWRWCGSTIIPWQTSLSGTPAPRRRSEPRSPNWIYCAADWDECCANTEQKASTQRLSPC